MDATAATAVRTARVLVLGEERSAPQGSLAGPRSALRQEGVTPALFLRPPEAGSLTPLKQ